MPEHLKHYKLKITALSPIHIRDGTVIGKKEYIRNRKEKKVIIPDNAKMFKDLIMPLNQYTKPERWQGVSLPMATLRHFH